MAKWYCKIDGNLVGPLSPTQIKQLVRSGQIQRDTPIRKGETGKWVRARKHSVLFEERVKSKPSHSEPDTEAEGSPENGFSLAQIPIAFIENILGAPTFQVLFGLMFVVALGIALKTSSFAETFSIVTFLIITAEVLVGTLVGAFIGIGLETVFLVTSAKMCRHKLDSIDTELICLVTLGRILLTSLVAIFIAIQMQGSTYKATLSTGIFAGIGTDIIVTAGLYMVVINIAFEKAWKIGLLVVLQRLVTFGVILITLWQILRLLGYGN